MTEIPPRSAKDSKADDEEEDEAEGDESARGVGSVHAGDGSTSNVSICFLIAQTHVNKLNTRGVHIKKHPVSSNVDAERRICARELLRAQLCATGLIG